MGADLYLESIYKPFCEECGELKVEIDPRNPDAAFDKLRVSGGYFSNGYNNVGDVMWAMGLSWWGPFSRCSTRKAIFRSSAPADSSI
jgi:hypothetical protein